MVSLVLALLPLWAQELPKLGELQVPGLGRAPVAVMWVSVVLELVVLEPAEAWPWKRAWPHLLEPHPKQVDLLHWCHLRSI